MMGAREILQRQSSRMERIRLSYATPGVSVPVLARMRTKIARQTFPLATIASDWCHTLAGCTKMNAMKWQPECSVWGAA
jgi:hypothetical protein